MCREPLFLKEGIMAFMLLTRRLACTFQHNYRLLVPSKPWGVLARTGPDGKHNPGWESPGG